METNGLSKGVAKGKRRSVFDEETAAGGEASGGGAIAAAQGGGGGGKARRAVGFEEETAAGPADGGPSAAAENGFSPLGPGMAGGDGEDTSLLKDLSPALGNGGAGSRQLRENYRAIVRARALYYPVAYRFPKELGRGRQGIVYLGLRQGARGCVTRHAIKLFDPGIYSSAEKYWTDMGRIAAQTSLLQQVKNPSLVAPDIYDETNGIGYVQMEAVDGVSLRELLDGKHLEEVRAKSSEPEWGRFTDAVFRLEEGRVAIQPGVALYILRLALRGLETLHEMGFVHSDVKPANLMVTRLGYVKLIDYGRALRDHERMTLLLGTPVYMAPETHVERTALATSDFYSLGLVGLEMLRGERLFDPRREHTEEELLQAKRELPGRLEELLPEHVRQNGALTELLRRLLAANPADRYRTAEEADAGMALVHKQLTLVGKDSEYGRELETYLEKIGPTTEETP